MFYRLSGGTSADDDGGRKTRGKGGRRRGQAGEFGQVTLFQATGVVRHGMIVLCLLDFVRVYLGQDFVVKLLRPCKTDMSLTCSPRAGIGFC